MQVSELYATIQGETRHAGRACALVRFAGCDLRCRYCDTAYARDPADGRQLSRQEVLHEIAGLGQRLVLLTGGEPLLQPDLAELCVELLGRGHEVMIETSGAHDIRSLPDGVIRIVDIKTPDSGESRRMCSGNLELLGSRDAVKLVVSSESDYAWARDLVAGQGLAARSEVLLSPAWGRLTPAALASWMLRDRLPARLNLPLHKLIWPQATRGV